MYDCSARQKYSLLLKRLVLGSLTSTAFFEHPDRYDVIMSKDPALKAIDDMVWFTYSEELPHRMTELPEKDRLFFERTFAFLASDLEYGWPTREFPKVAELGMPIKILTLGLSSFADMYLQKKAKSFWTEYASFGDLTVWPFIDRHQYMNVQSYPKLN